MSAERKKIESTIPRQFQLDQSSSNEITKDLEKKKNTSRPNIDHMLKRIISERKKEKKSALAMMALGICIMAIISLYFTQGL